MKKKIAYYLLAIFTNATLCAQVVLNANGPGNTYEEINNVLAPAYNVVEVPDCNHTKFGRHIDEIFDKQLNTNVFRFHAHKIPDNDRCKKFDRQRVEIKTYSKSPDNLKAIQGETVEYKWKFKLDKNFQPSSGFTHIHQIKSVGGPFASIPMITLTLRKATKDRLELRHTSTKDQSTIAKIDLSLLKGHWVEVTELIKYGDSGSYSIKIKRVSNEKILLNYFNNSIDTWQNGANFARQKWGIYRSLNSPDDLRDEEVLFANFSIEEINSLSVDDLNVYAENVFLSPNPSSEFVKIKNLKPKDFDSIVLYDTTGKAIILNKRLKKNKIDISGLQSGLYYIVFKKNKRAKKVLKCLVK